ncbi:hypothetical protein ACFYRL_13420 [Streptomyces goshikiensis]|uniref:hypothetical protein n=1 Tax=Streptomyces goshikiensis TaxID=1942 RepID=UPI0036C21A3C
MAKVSSLPERSGGPWTDGGVEGRSTRVRVNAWGEAAQADAHLCKAEDLGLGAYGKTARATSTMDPTAFAPAPDGRLTVRRLSAR